MIEFTLLPVVAFLAALLSIAAIMVVVGMASQWSGRLFQYLMMLIVVASTGTIILSGRALRAGPQGLEVFAEGDMSGGATSKVLLAAVVGCSFAVCCAWLFTPRKMAKTRATATQPPIDIIISFMIFYLASSIVPIFFGEHYYFHVSLIYPFFVYLALFLTFQVSKISPVVIAKQCIGVVVTGSLLAAIVLPELAIQPGYTGLVPGFQLRLWGITAHPNGVGSVASVLLLLEIAEPSRRKWLNWGVVAVSAVALILSQSKASIAAALLGLVVMLAWRLQANLGRQNGPPTASLELRNRFTIGILLAGAFVVGILVMFFDVSSISGLDRRLNLQALSDVSTATGRTWIWAVAIQAGLENPLFGQGGDYWTLATRLQYGLSGASHAHNLFLQVFSRAGLTGLLALIVFVYYLVRYSVRAAKITRGGSLALMVLFFFRAMFEVPIQPNSILGAEFFAAMAYIYYVMEKGARSLATLKRRDTFALSLDLSTKSAQDPVRTTRLAK